MILSKVICIKFHCYFSNNKFFRSTFNNPEIRKLAFGSRILRNFFCIYINGRVEFICVGQRNIINNLKHLKDRGAAFNDLISDILSEEREKKLNKIFKC